MRYFKVIRGWGSENFIPIDETELEKATYAHMTGKVVVFNNGSINGDAITAIQPDYHREMGWAYGHDMGPDDWNDLNDKNIPYKYAGVIGKAKAKVQYLMQSGKENLIGQNVKLPELEKPKRIDGLDDLAKGMTIKH